MFAFCTNPVRASVTTSLVRLDVRCVSCWLLVNGYQTPHATIELHVTGHETTGVALARMLTLLPKHSEVLQRLREEQAQLQSRHGLEITGGSLKGLERLCLGHHSCEVTGSEAEHEAASRHAMQEVPCLIALHHDLLTSNIH